MKKILPLALLLIIVSSIYYQFVFQGKVPLPADTLVGAYFPWLDYKWGYTVGVPVKNALTSDAFSTFFVWKKIIVDSFRAGIIPLWNHSSFSGTPLFATFHSTVFNPANLFLFLPLHGWSFYIFLSSLAAALSMYIFLGNYIKHPLAKAIGALIFAFSGPMTTWAEFGTAVWAAAILPLLLHFVRLSLSEGHWKQMIMLPLLTAWFIFSGHVQLLTYAAVIIPLFGILTIRQEKHFDKRRLVHVAFSLLLGVGIGAVQLLPTQEFFSRSIRGEEKYAQTFNFGLSPLVESVRLIAADIFGHPARGNHYSPVSYHEYSSYLGALTIPLILYLLLSGKLASTSKFFLAFFLSSLILAFENPLSKLIFSLPLPLLTYSSASRLFFITGFSGGFLAAQAIEKISHAKNDFGRLAVSVLYPALFILLFLASVHTIHRAVSLKNGLVYLGLLAFFIVSSAVLRRKRALLIFSILVLFSLDLGRYFNNYNTFVKRELVFPSTPIIEWLRDRPGTFRIARENTALLPPNTWGYYGLESIEGYDPLYSQDYARFFHVVNGKVSTDAVSRYALLERINKKFLDALNVKYVLAVNPKPGESDSGTLYEIKQSTFKEVYRNGRVSVWENPEVLSRAYFIDRLIASPTKKTTFEIIHSDDFDPRTEAVLTEKIDPFTTGESKVISIDEKNNKVRLAVSSEKGGFLVLADSFDPGWKAKINGQKTAIYQVNGALMGISVPSGESEIVFSYLPDSFITGAVISLLSLVFLPVLLIFSRWLSTPPGRGNQYENC